jgi:hypothetical protein
MRYHLAIDYVITQKRTENIGIVIDGKVKGLQAQLCSPFTTHSLGENRHQDGLQEQVKPMSPAPISQPGVA